MRTAACAGWSGGFLDSANTFPFKVSAIAMSGVEIPIPQLPTAKWLFEMSEEVEGQKNLLRQRLFEHILKNGGKIMAYVQTKAPELTTLKLMNLREHLESGGTDTFEDIGLSAPQSTIPMIQTWGNQATFWTRANR